MGEAARRRRASAASRQVRRSTAPLDAGEARELASSALARLVRLNAPGKVSIAGAYALGYGGLGIAQQEGDDPDWFNELDPLDTLFLGTAWPRLFRDAYEFGNARTAWIRLMRTTQHWRGIERFVTEVVQASEDHELPVDDGDLMLLVAGRLEQAGLDQRKLPAGLLPGAALANARFLRGPAPDLPLPTPPADAREQAERLLTGTKLDLPHDGTPADALRAGLHLLANAGLDIHTNASVLLPALYLSLVAKDDELLQEAGERAEAWALGVPDDSSVTPVLDFLLLAPRRRLDVATTLKHLFGLPGFTQPVDPADRTFTSTPGGALPQVAFDLGFQRVVTRDGKIMRLDADGVALIEAQAEAFEARFGRPPGPGDPLFFDPDADTPQPVPVAGLEAASTTMMETAGICPAWIYAYQHTNGLLPRLDGSFISDADADEWDAAIDRYLSSHPGQTIDDDAELAKLRTVVAMSTINMAAHTPGFGASLLERLNADPEPDSDAALVRDFLSASAATIRSFLQDPNVASTASELARAWSGAALAGRVHAATAVGGPEPATDVLLSVAAARMTETG